MMFITLDGLYVFHEMNSMKLPQGLFALLISLSHRRLAGNNCTVSGIVSSRVWLIVAATKSRSTDPGSLWAPLVAAGKQGIPQRSCRYHFWDD